MPNTVLVGAQWGDEGKGKVIDVLTREADWVVRYQGGNNAGHTVKVGEAQYVLHLLPSGILHPGKVCVLGNGMVVDPVALVAEIEELEQRGIRTAGRLFVSDRAHLVLPYHRALDEGRENRGGRAERIGTTRRGIGPAYGDKALRIGLRMADLVDPAFAERLAPRLEEANRVLAALGGAPIDAAEAAARCAGAAARLAPFVADTAALIQRAAAEGRALLFEGAQGTMLDIDFGSYPFVTSSNTTAGGAVTGTGLPPRRIDRVVGVLKAYTTRVGEGPLPTELTDETGERLRRAGGEYGATTGRPRRCGWFDAVVARYAAALNGIDYWALTKLDVLDGEERVRIAVAYECAGRRLETVPADARRLAQCRPIYEELPGWRASTREARRFEDLPAAAQTYVRRLCELTGVPLGLLSVGPGRENTIRLAI